MTPSPRSSAAGPKPSAGPGAFSSNNYSGRIEKRARSERPKEPGMEQNQDIAEAEPEPESTETQSPRRIQTRASHNTTTSAQDGEAGVNEGKKKSGGVVLYHTISSGGPTLKTIGDLLAEVDPHQNFAIPANHIIASVAIDTRIREQMVRVVQKGNLTPVRVRYLLADSTSVCKSLWSIREQSRALFWSRVCKSSWWLKQIDGADCREFFLAMCVCFRNGSGKQPTNNMTKGFRDLHDLFQKEQNSELDEYVSADVSRPNQPLDGSRAASRNSTSRKKGSKAVSKDSNIFRRSGNTNMTEFERRGVDVKGLKPIIDTGLPRLEEGRERERMIRALTGVGTKDEAAAAAETVAAAASGPLPKSTPAGKDDSGNRDTPIKVSNQMLAATRRLGMGRIQETKGSAKSD
ncbi:hypothetical protein N8I77_001712 [Diaporthe amygdali]|uniref:SRCR domain-containing protein n=1 Tax=Phomopsis amygdali TaxID=1214568 RepID=A0AAD9SS77_PHOAM|nr:hypothetical protein N8I77_001712 [Diaporthe amygdali]